MTALKTLSLRIRGYDEETEQLSDDVIEATGKVADLTKVASNNFAGVSLWADAAQTQYRSLKDYLGDIAAIWNEIDSKSRTDLLERLFGKRGASVGSAILQNFDQVEKAIDEMEKSAGAANAEMSIIRDSVTYKINNLKEVWTGFFQQLLSRQDIGELIDSATNASEKFANVIEALIPVVKELLDLLGMFAEGIGSFAEKTGGAFPVILGALGIATFRNSKEAKGGLLGMLLGGDITKQVKDLINEIDDDVENSDLLMKLQEPTEEIAEETKGKLREAFDNVKDNAIESFEDIKEKASKAIDIVKGKVSAMGTAFTGAGGGIKGVGAAMTALMSPAAWAALAAAVGVATVAFVAWYNSVDQVIKRAEEARKKNKELADALKSEADGYKQSADELSDLYEKYKDATRGSDEYYEVVSKIADLSPTLVTRYNEEGEAIAINTSLIEAQIEAYKELADAKQQEAQAQASENAEVDVEQYKNFQKRLEDSNKKIDRLQKALVEYNEIGYFTEESGFLGYEKESVEELLENELKNARKYSLQLAEIKADVINNWLGMLDPIDEGLSDVQKEVENNIRGLIASIGSIEDNDFQDLYDAAKSVRSSLWKDMFTLEQGDLSNAEYKKQAKAIYDKIISEMVASGFELTEGQKLALMVELQLVDGISDEAKNLADRFAPKRENARGERQQFGPDESDLNRNAIENWYDDLSKADRALVDENEEFVEQARRLYSVTGDYNKALSQVLEQMKNIAYEANHMFNVAEFEEQDNDLESMQTLYNSFRDNVEGDKIKVPLDISDVEKLPDTWKELDEFKEFELKVTTDDLSVDEVQRAFDDIATAYARNMMKVEGVTKETMEMVKSQMKLDGLEEEGVNKFVDAVAAEDKMNEFVQTLQSGQDAQGHFSEKAIESAKSIYEEAQQLGLADEMLQDFLLQAAATNGIVISGDDTWLDLLAEKLGIDIALLKELRGLATGNGVVVTSNGQKGYVPTSVTAAMNAQKTNKQKEENDKKYKNLSWTPTSNTSAASSAGSSDGDAYVSAYEKELEELGKLKDQGLITEKQYLDRMRALYEKYFRGLSQYQDKYNEEQQKYLEGMLSLYNSAISAVGSIIDRRIKGLNKERDAIIKGYEDQKKAIQAVIDAKQEQIDGIQDEIDAIQDEIDAINKANEARQRQLNLQQDLYNMERLMSQRTRLVYKNGQMVYQNDTRELRDAREKVYQDQIQEEIAAKEEQIAQKEKEIKLIEKEIEALEKQQEAIDKMIEDTNEYFDKLIEALEDYKDRWQELAELEEQAKLMAVLEELGYSTDDILNMSEEVFQAFKGEYLGILKDMNSGNDYFLDSLGKLAEVDMGNIPGYLEQTADAINSMDTGNLDNLEQGLKDVDSALGGGGGSTAGGGGASGGGGTSTGGGSGIVGKANDASQALQDMSDVDLTALDTALQNILKICQGLDEIFGKENNFATLIKSLGDSEGLSLQGLIDQFTALQEAVIAVSTALGGGGSEGENLTDKGFPDSKGESKTGSEGGTGLLQAIQAVNDSDLSNIIGQFGGSSGEKGEENGGESLLSAVQSVMDKIGNEDTADDPETLVGTIATLPTLTEEPLVEVKTQFEELKTVIEECVSAVNNLADAISNIKMPSLGGGLFSSWTGTAYASGTAYSKGNWSAGSKGHKGGKALVGELGPEIVVSNNGKYRTVGDHGAEFVNLKKSDIVFNHVQSAALLSKGKTKGRAYANGTLPEGFSPLSDAESRKYGLFDKVKDIGQKLEVSNVALKSIDRTVQQISNSKTTVNNNPVINVSNVQFTCTGVTGEDVLHQIESQFTGIISKAYQQSMAQ